MPSNPGGIPPQIPKILINGVPWDGVIDDIPRKKPKLNHSTNIDRYSHNADIEGSQSSVYQNVGMTAEVRDLYREDSRQPWKRGLPSLVRNNPSSAPELGQFALTIRREKRQSDTGEQSLRIHSISVHSPSIKKLLGSVLGGYQGVNTNLERIDFYAPFHAFFYRWEDFKAQMTKNHDGDEAKHCKLLFEIMRCEVEPLIEQAEDMLNNNVISFEYLWTLFEPGIEIHYRAQEEDNLYLLTDGRYELGTDRRPVYKISCRYIDTDGERFGYKTTSLTIQSFNNVTPISELNVLPSHLRHGITEIRARLAQRGRKFERLRGAHYMAYSGAYNLRKPTFNGTTRQTLEDGRILVDCASYMKYTGNTTDSLGSLEGPTTTSGNLDSVSSEAPLDGGYCDIFNALPQLPAFELSRYAAKQTKRIYTPHQLESAASFNVDMVDDIKWDGHAFDHLVLEEDYKRIIWALVNSKLSHSDDFDDVVKGKGRGIIMLLSGEPGTGKTLTSETVAESMKKPLYSISASDLGDAAADVETNLRRILELSAKWNAVLLIDECDIFLEQRTASDLRRNKIVSVFLRLLEYYQGVLFLTTNRVASFDPAFESRIDLTINYPELDFNSRLQIWKMFIKPGASRCTVHEADLERLSCIKLNGRQIKNIVKTATLLASGEQKALAMEYFEIVLRAKKCFDSLDIKYMAGGYRCA
ncbi:hypothetical protein NPX13_g1008 [Xylaria arbuscula]|uniref:AAA+ ATPase domain-containing protein n=1 Tax=Xylaria arbuscula TaxID=114810 RepID=A0A9W8NNC5_9PEZI|nr:hypothetical protein NPX13_g1008 [Xylaria arbuscula]